MEFGSRLTQEQRDAFRRNLPRFREELGKAMGLDRPATAEELADLSGQKIDTIRGYETGLRGPGAAPLMAIAKVLGRPVEDLIMNDPPPPPAGLRPQYAVRFKIVGTPPPGLDEAIRELLAKWTPEKLAERDRLKRETERQPRTIQPRKKPPRKP